MFLTLYNYDGGKNRDTDKLTNTSKTIILAEVMTTIQRPSSSSTQDIYSVETPTNNERIFSSVDTGS